MQSALPLGLYNPVDLKVLDVIDKNAVWCLLHTPRDELQWKFLGFGGKALLSTFER